MIINANGNVDTRQLDIVRGHLKACKAAEVLEALAVFDSCTAALRKALHDGNAAHDRPHRARRAHHDLIVHDRLAGREPDDGALWAEVLEADDELLRAQARYAATQDALNRAAYAFGGTLTRAWPQLMPYVAGHRSERLPGLDVLAVSFTWPAMVDPPGVETLSDVGHFVLLCWPPVYETLDPYHERREKCELNEWLWAELDAGRYDCTDNGIAFHHRWPVPRYSTTSNEGARQAFQPVVFVTAERIAGYQEQIALRK